jgi:putative transferase (TIGR04331 family)
MIKNSYTLVTSGLKETRGNNNLFLGHWCLDYNELPKLQRSIIMPYHWSNYQKLENDYQAVNVIYEKVLVILSEKLNEIHSVNYTNRYWRILLGPWLGYFIQGMFDKWENLNNALNNFNIESTSIVNISCESMIPNDMIHFANLLRTNEWHHYCYSEILKKTNHFKSIKKYFLTKNIYQNIQKSNFFSFKSSIKLNFIRLINLFSKNNKILIASSYLGSINETRLNLRLRQPPFFYINEIIPPVKPDIDFRNKLSLTFNAKNEFEKYLEKNIFLHIPTCFLEGYNNLINTVKKSTFPKHPKLIYTSNFTFFDTVSMAYTAINVENGTKLIHGQHGGYGVPRFLFLEDHEIRIADKYLSWGWKKDNPKIIPLGMPIPVSGYKRNGTMFNDLLLVRGLWPKYTFRMDSGAGLNLNNAIEDSLNFARLISDKIRKESLLIRLYHSDYGYNEILRWETEFPDVRISKKNEKINNLVRKSRLVVYTYNLSTGYFEYINANIPTIIFWDMSASPVSNEALEVFKYLKEVGIFHDSPESAAIHVNNIWNDVDSWWNSSQVIIAREKFCNKFAYFPKDIISDVETILRENL